jgi:hypothetical protein
MSKEIKNKPIPNNIKLDKNGHPKWKNVLKLANYFRLIEVNTDNKASVSMGTGCVFEIEDHLCGTPACHAGWFGIFYDDHAHDFDNYARIMARMLGFNYTAQELEDWASENADLWGNNDGYSIFSDAAAFGSHGFDTGRGKLTMHVIADHWYGVAERLYNLQVLKQAP